MTKNNIKSVFFASFLLIAGIVSHQSVSAAGIAQTPKNYDGIITQIYSDGSFTLRVRDGSFISVSAPFLPNMFVTVKGILDPSGKSMKGVAQITTKNSNGSDAIPVITMVDPGSGQIGNKITITGTGFAKKTNSVWIGDIKYALINIPSKDGKTLTFQMPPAPCNQKAKIACPTSVIQPGDYNILVSNENGVSNFMPFHLTPLPPLTITTDILPQVMGKIRSSMKIYAVGGAEGYNWRITDGALPAGMILSRAACLETPCRTDGIISGIPSTPGTYQFTVTLTSGQEISSRQYTIVVVQPLNNSY